MSSQRGTNSNSSEDIFIKFVTENKHLKSFISKNKEGQKISSCKGTKSLWIRKQPKPTIGVPFKRILVVNRGTRRVIF